MLTTDELREVALALGIGAVAANLVDAQIGVRAIRQAHRRAGAADFLHRHHVRNVAHVRTAQLLRHRQAMHAHLTQLAPEVGGEEVVAVDLRGTRGDFGLSEGANGIAQRGDVLAQREGEGGFEHRAGLRLFIE